mmetsp:Transcript_159793/g.508681  ORF Transcript_159793/g.508681 Transcript_159793/m.508681 type:complete len:82 (+) Transcript_159793:1734-1979(+)
MPASALRRRLPEEEDFHRRGHEQFVRSRWAGGVRQVKAGHVTGPLLFALPRFGLDSSPAKTMIGGLKWWVSAVTELLRLYN